MLLMLGYNLNKNKITSGWSEQATSYIFLQVWWSQAPEVEQVHLDVSRPGLVSPEGCRLSSPGPGPDSGPAAPPGPGKGVPLPAQQKTHTRVISGFQNAKRETCYSCVHAQLVWSIKNTFFLLSQTPGTCRTVGLMLATDRMSSICRLLKLDRPMDLTRPFSTSFSMAAQVSL